MDLGIAKPVFYPLLGTSVAQLLNEFSLIPEVRKSLLKRLGQFVQQKLRAGETAELIFICTHNSRRSHIAQVWSQTAAFHFGFSNVLSYSGGTEATEISDRAINAIRQAGFKIEKTSDSDNPVYEVRYSADAKPVKTYSKIFSADGNPKKHFCAVMTCSQADTNCPLVPGAEQRIAIHYGDPKDFDGTAAETSKYHEAVRQIGREMFYAFSTVSMRQL